MKNIIKITNWINRVLVIPFALCLLLAIIDFAFLYYAAYIAFVLGIYQVLSFLVTSFYYNRLNNQRNKNLLLYILLVIIYFIHLFLIGYYNYNYNKYFSSLIYLLYIIPVLLSFFWTYILESINKEL